MRTQYESPKIESQAPFALKISIQGTPVILGSPGRLCPACGSILSRRFEWDFCRKDGCPVRGMRQN